MQSVNLHMGLGVGVAAGRVNGVIAVSQGHRHGGFDVPEAMWVFFWSHVDGRGGPPLAMGVNSNIARARGPRKRLDQTGWEAEGEEPLQGLGGGPLPGRRARTWEEYMVLGSWRNVVGICKYLIL
jgi:hypothetical protein